MKLTLLALSLTFTSTLALAATFADQQISSIEVYEISLDDQSVSAGVTSGATNGGRGHKPGPAKPGSGTGQTSTGTNDDSGSSATTDFTTAGIGNGTGSNFGTDYGFGYPFGNGSDPITNTGRIIDTASTAVALGQAIYDLVQKGKPSNVTEYAPISIVPKDPLTKEVVDLFDLEGFKEPIRKKFTTVVKDKAGEVAIRFEYIVVFSYGGSYNGHGKYIMGAAIIPVKVDTKFGWDFNATMKLSGMMNHGTKADPVAGAMLTMKYQMNSWRMSFERNDTIHITGNGDIKVYSAK